MWAELLRALVEGVIRPLVEAWQQYQHGRTAQQRDDARATLDLERRMEDAVEESRAHRPAADLDELQRRVGGQAPGDARPPRQ